MHLVSQMWSRQNSTPDWTNQTRIVNRGEDIVINCNQGNSESGQGVLSPQLEKSHSEAASSSNTLETKKPPIIDSADAIRRRTQFQTVKNKNRLMVMISSPSG